MILFKGLCKQFGSIRALDNICFSIKAGSVTAIAGPNGSGKTTLIKILLGLVKPDSGSVEFNGLPLNGHHEYRRQIGYMPQDPQFPENLRVVEVLRLVRSVRGRSSATSEALLQRLKVNGELRKKVGTLSGGTRQRLSAAIAFMFMPDLVILDEPTAGLDPVSARVLKDEIADHRSAGKSVIISSHILSDIDELADDIIFLNDGLCAYSGSKSALHTKTGKSTLERSFLALLGEESAP